MTSFKRPRQNVPKCGRNVQRRRQPSSTIFMSVFAIVQILSSPSAVNSFAFSPEISPRYQQAQTLLSQTKSHVLHAHGNNKNSSNAYRKRTISSSAASKNDIDRRNRKEAQYELFHTYHAYKEIQSAIEQQGLTHATLEEQAYHLNKSPSELERILSDGSNARQSLLLDNTPLVHNTVYKLTNARRASKSLVNLSNDDLVQEGTIGLLRAIDKFDPSLGHAFSTYAVYWIRASVTRCIQSREEMIRVPEYLDRAIRLIDSVLDDKAVVQLMTGEQKNGEVRLKRVMKLTGLSQSVIKEALKVKRRRMLNQSGSSRGGYAMLEDYMMTGSYSRDAQRQQQQQHYVTDSQDIMREGQLEHVKGVLGEYLSMREIEALSWRYGLLNFEEEKTQPEAEPQRGMPNGARDYEAEAEETLFGPGTIFSPTMEAATSARSLNKASTVKTTTKARSASKAKVSLSGGGRWGEAMSFKEVGEQMRVSAEYGRRLCSSALKKLQAAADDGRLDPAMLF